MQCTNAALHGERIVVICMCQLRRFGWMIRREHLGNESHALASKSGDDVSEIMLKAQELQLGFSSVHSWTKKGSFHEVGISTSCYLENIMRRTRSFMCVYQVLRSFARQKLSLATC